MNDLVLTFITNFLRHIIAKIVEIGARLLKVLQQKGWLSPTERASVSAISLRHILASPGYASGTIAVNFT